MRRQHGISGLIDRVQLCLFSACAGLSDVYAPLFAHFEAQGYRRGTDLFPFAFDWRRDITTNANLLLAEIDRIRSVTGAARVDVVAHSQGGLVTRAALADPRSVGKVRRVATLGTPILGATQFLGVLEYREPCQSAELFGGCVLNRERAQQLATNWPGALALLPSAGYYQAYGSPINRLIDDDRDGRNTGYLSPAAVRSRLVDRNLALIDQASALHRGIDSWAPADRSVALTRFVGTGLGTIERVEEYRREECTGALWWRKCRLVDAIRMQYGNGDGTVAQHAADVHDPATGLDLRGTGTNRYVSASHGDLVKDASVLAAVSTFLHAPTSTTATPTTATPTTTTTTTTTTTMTGASASAGTSTKPSAVRAAGTTASAPAEPLIGLEVAADGPVALEVTDSSGRRTGSLDPAAQPVVYDVPGSSAVLGEASANVFLTQQDRYRTTLVATADGDVTLRLGTYAGDGVAQVRSLDPVHVTRGSRLMFDLAAPVHRGTVQVTIDEDGDGRLDRRERVRPAVARSAARDRSAPKAAVALRPVTGADGERLTEVTVTATDRGGSGVARVDYATGAEGVYTEPFLVPAEGVLHVRCRGRRWQRDGSLRPSRTRLTGTGPVYDERGRRSTAINASRRPACGVARRVRR